MRDHGPESGPASSPARPPEIHRGRKRTRGSAAPGSRGPVDGRASRPCDSGRSPRGRPAPSPSAIDSQRVPLRRRRSPPECQASSAARHTRSHLPVAQRSRRPPTASQSRLGKRPPRHSPEPGAIRRWDGHLAGARDVGKPEASKWRMGPTAPRPSARPSQKARAPTPRAETTPQPVMTARLMTAPHAQQPTAPSSPSGPVLRARGHATQSPS